MSLSCECDSDMDCAWYYYSPIDYGKLETKKRKRCSSCKELINIGAVCTEFHRYSIDEEGDEYGLASMHHCEKCADIYFNLDALGFSCIEPDESMPQLLSEYHEAYGAKK